MFLGFAVIITLIIGIARRQQAKINIGIAGINASLIPFQVSLKEDFEKALKPFHELLEEEEPNEEEAQKQQEQLSAFIQQTIGTAIEDKLDGLKNAINGSLGANTKSLIKMEKLKATDDKTAIYEGMVEMLPGFEPFLEFFNMKKSVKKHPEKLMEYIAIADMITKGEASNQIARLQEIANKDYSKSSGSTRSMNQDNSRLI